MREASEDGLLCPSPRKLPIDVDAESIQSRFESPHASPTKGSLLNPAAPRTRRIAFLTSGGDSQGMNAAIRAIVRTAIAHKCHPVAVFDGFTGLIEGSFKRMTWDDVASILGEGGTVIRSSRCPEFVQPEGRRKAVLNLLREGIDKLIVIGGDGSLTGADTLRAEWPMHVEALVREGAVDAGIAVAHPHLMVVGLVGSIDNDMCGTEITIGADTSLHRIIEAVDCIRSTAMSHSRAFIVEVMGRHCGWLALNAALAVGADWLLVPESPPPDGWEAHMCRLLARNRELGKRATIVIVAEGAVDRNSQPIRAAYLQRVLSDSLQLDSRVTTLGHVQRGGSPSSFDRYLGTVQGVRGVLCLLAADPAASPSLLIVKQENRIGTDDLRACVARTRAASSALRDREFDKVYAMRDPDFVASYELLRSLNVYDPECLKPKPSGRTLAIICNGAPCGGMNAAVWAAVYYSLFRGHKVLGVANSFSGLAAGEIRELQWSDVEGWIWRGGCELGTNRTFPSASNIDQIVKTLERHSVSGVIVIGGFEAFTSQLFLTRERSRFDALKGLPMVCLPATISNNVPGTEYSVGSDTALNAIVGCCDAIKQSASSSRKRVFVVEVQGGNSGYLATMAGLGGGATRSYIPEEGLRLRDLQRDVDHLKRRFRDDKKQGRLVIRNENASTTYTTELTSRILEEEADGEFDSRWTILGHLQQGSHPSPMDRIRAVRLAVLCVKRIEEHWSTERLEAESVLVGIQGPEVKFTPVVDLLPDADMEKRCCRRPWWMGLRSLVRMLAKYGPGPDSSDDPSFYGSIV